MKKMVKNVMLNQVLNLIQGKVQGDKKLITTHLPKGRGVVIGN
jgi:hypothetical protein